MEPSAPSAGWRGPLTVVALVLTGLWTVAVVLGAQVTAWYAQFVLEVGLGRPASGWLWLLAGVLAAVAVGVPASLLAVIPRAPAARATARVWALSALALAALSVPRAVVPQPHHAGYLLGLALTAAALAIALRTLAGGGRAGRNPGRADPAGRDPGRADPAGRDPGRAEPAGRDASRAEPAGRDASRAVLALAVAAGLASVLPWLWLGSLGDPVESVAALVAALAVGWLAGYLLDPRFWAPYAGMRPALRLPVAGLAAGVALAPLAAGTGQSGVALAQLLAVPPLGVTLAALAALAGPAATGWHTGRAPTRWSRWPVAACVAAAAFGPLAFVDPDETSLVLGTADIGYWALVAALVAAGVAAVVGGAYAVLAALRRVRPRGWAAGLIAAAIAAAGVAVYCGPGRAGFYGDRLLVVLKAQADLDGLAGIGERGERVRATYRRLVDTAARTQAPLRRELSRLHLRFTPYYLVNAVEVDAPPSLRGWLSRRAEVDRVLLSPRLRPLPRLATPAPGRRAAPDGPQWNITSLGTDRVWRELGVTGTGIVVGSSDSGVDGTHPALRDGYRGGDDSWYDPWRGSRAPSDRDGHGTHTTATAVGARNVGVAPGARWVGCVNLDRNLGNPARYLDCLQFMLAPFPPGGDPWRDGRPERAPHVLTNSWGCPPMEGCDARALRPAAAALAAAGIFVVVAAGNTGYGGCRTVTDPPATYPETLTVGALDARGRLAEFSSRGPAPGGLAKPELVAPGDGVLSAWPGGGYAEESGTSMAAPHVAGVVALMWSANPALVGDVERTRAILTRTAHPLPADGTGCGPAPAAVDAYAAVRAALGR